uniref:Uncharacterized protein n=1 Tax=Strongyloides stercoralis TaxID=6248 RepID=A0A0K0ETF5_STRER
MDINKKSTIESFSKYFPQKNTPQTNSNEKRSVTQGNDLQKNDSANKQSIVVKNNSKKDLYYNRKLMTNEGTPKRSRPKKDEGKTIALSDDEWENAGNPLGFEKLGTVKGKKKINIFTNLKEKDLEEQIALLGNIDLNELSACDESFNSTKKSIFPPNNNLNFENNQLMNIEDLKTNALPSFIGLLAKTFVENYLKNKSGKILLTICLDNDS